MKKEVAFSILLLVIIFGGVASATGDVAYIYRKQFNIDDTVVSSFNQMGLDVDFIDERTLPLDFSAYRLLFVGDENYRREHLIPVHDYPTVIANYYHMDSWGYTDADGVSQIASSNPLNVLFNNQLIQVYTSATESQGGASISYYYLDDGNKAPSLETIVKAETSDITNGGDVISHAGSGDQLFNGQVQHENMCFFGIVNSDFWTFQSENFFEECVQFVAAECTVDADCGGNFSGALFCEDGNVVQDVTSNSCVGSGLPECIENVDRVLVENCEFGCSAGACLEIECFDDSGCDDFDLTTEDICHFPGTPDSFCTSEDIECFVDVDCGNNTLVGDPVCSPDNDVVQLFESFECVNAGTGSSFCTFGEEEQIIRDCVDLCTDATCVGVTCFDDSDCEDTNPLTLDECINPGTQVSECRNTLINCGNDLDCGPTGFVGTEFCTGDNIEKNFQTSTCQNDGTTDSFCTIVVEPVTLDMCETACFEGGCIVCDENLDCDDGDLDTLDKCVASGTIQSHCLNEDIDCFDDSDCGLEGSFGDLFCMDLNLTQQFKDFTCNSPGNASSFCSFEILPIVNETCSDLCENGACLEVECSVDLDCDDGNVSTSDACVNPGESNSFCTHDGIACFNELDCGIDGHVGEEFCSFGDVVQNFVDYTCNEAGTTGSSCSSVISDTIVENCNFGCDESMCIVPVIECDTDLDCGVDGFVGEEFCSEGDVNELFRTYECENPGTPESDCSFSDEGDVVEACEFGCEAGICLDPVIECITDSDCGENGFVGDLFCSNNDVNELFRTYECENPGTPESDCSFVDDEQLVEICSDVCAQGVCIDVLCNVDADCGVNGLIEEPFCTGNDISQLFEEHECVNEGTEESFCQTDVSEEIIEECEFGCEDAMCLELVCGSDTDCDDDNPDTYDQCINPGTLVSLCKNTPVSCGSDVDCGIDQVIGVTFCWGDDVYQNFQDFMCLNPGTTTSACIFNVESVFVDQCTGACFDGNCIICDEDLDCDDGNSETSDLCLMPGGIESHCVSEVVVSCMDECVDGSLECSADGFRSCGNFDADDCTEWGSVTSCEVDQSCSAGACVDNPPVCTDECTGGSRECSEGGFRACGDGNGDGCNEWGPVLQCGSLETCVSGFCI